MNKDLFILINSSTNISILPYLLQIISGIFKIWNFAFVYVIASIYLAFKMRKENFSKDDFDKIFNEMFHIGTIYAFFGLAYAAIKFSVNMPRPFCSLTTSQFITIADISDERCLSSFPSAHTSLAILVTYFAWTHLKITGKFFMILITLCVATSRITLAMHYPADIIYSAAISFIIIFAGKFFCKILQCKLLAYIKDYIYKMLITKR